MFIVKARIRLKSNDMLQDVCLWCHTYIGTENVDWYWSYVSDNPFDNQIDFAFVDELHAAYFSLRWL